MTLSPHCRRGHLFTEMNTLVRVQRGFGIRTCRKCIAMHKRLKYRTDSEFRERKKAIERQRHRDNKTLLTMENAQ